MKFWRRTAGSAVATAPEARRYRRSPDVMSAEQGGRTILLDLRSEQYFALDAVGAAVWERLDGGRTVGEVAGCIAGDWQAPPDEVCRDVTEFVAALARDGLAEECR
jgi:hypothetical protein